MRRYIFAGTALGLCVAMMGCSGSSKKDQPAAGAVQKASSPAWTLQLKSTCLNAANDQCVGKYGFSVSADGKFLVGSGPKGQKLEGVLTDAEFASLKTELQPLLSSAASLEASANEGHEDGVSYESDDSITLVRPGKKTLVLAHNAADQFFYNSRSFEEAKSLHKAIRDLADTYYRLPFGDDCADAVSQIEALYPTVQNCQVDSDCVYVNFDKGYEIVEPNAQQSILVNRCEAIKPLVVANRINIQGAAGKLMDAWSAARTTCGVVEFNPRPCFFKQGWTGNAPVCVQNRCQSQM